MSLRRLFSNLRQDRTSRDEPVADQADSQATDQTESGVAPLAAPDDEVNLAAEYRVAVEPILAQQELTRHWKVRRVRHLTPEENEGRHHIFVRAHFAEESETDEALVRISWEDGAQDFKLERNPRGDVLSFAMFTWQTCQVSMADSHSEQVTGLTANHPDELSETGDRTGNTLFHHSFLVEFEEIVETPRKSFIHGQVINGSDLTLQLTSNGEVLASGRIKETGEFKFKKAPAGTYVLQVTDPETDEMLAQSRPLEVDGINSVEVELEVPPSVEIEEEQIEVAPPEAELPELKPAAAEETRPPEMPPAAAASGQNAADMQEPMSSSAINHYILFGPREHFATKVYLPLLMSQLLASNATFGFDPDEAQNARKVTILASPDVLPESLDDGLRQRGIQVSRAHGDLERIRAAIENAG